MTDNSNEIVVQLLMLSVSAKGLVALCVALPVAVVILVLAYRLATK